MANQTQIGSLVIDLQLKTQALEKGLESAKKKLQEIEGQNKQVENSNKSLDTSFIALSATAVMALMKISSAIKDCVNEYNAYTQAMSSLQNVSEYTGESMSDLSKIMDDYSSYMTKSDLATTIKNFSLMGMTAKETEKMIEALTNSAIRNRNANYTVSEAVRVASEGYRQGLSTLSDSAGVTENLSVMLDKYAQSIGKTASQLTEAEKNQAYLNRTMYAAEPFAGAMEEYLDSLAGKQGEYSQAMRETQVTFIEALEPTLTSLLEYGTNILNILNSLIGSNKSITVGVVSFATTLLTLAAAVIAVKKAYDLYKVSAFAATAATHGFTAALSANPIGIAILAISTLIGVITSLSNATRTQKEAQAKLNETTERYNKLQNETLEYTEENITKAQENTQAIKEQITLMERKLEIEKQIDEMGGDSQKITEILDYETMFPASGGIPGILKEITGKNESIRETNNALNKLHIELTGIQKDLEQSQTENGNFGNSIDELNKRLKEESKFLENSNVIQEISKSLDVESIKTKQKQAAELNKNAKELQNYLHVLQNADKNSTEYQQALQKISNSYPEAVSAAGPLIPVLEGIVGAQQLQADEAWNASQTSIQGHIANIQAAINDESIQRQVAQNMGIAYDENFKPKLESILALLQAIGNYTPETTPTVTPTSTQKVTKSSGSSSSYSNKRLDNYKKEIEHKKALDQLSLQQEISMYEYALRNYAKTADERNEIREKIYDLNKELAQKEKEMLEQQTEDYEAYIQEQKNLRGSAYDITEQTRDYNKIIQMHKNYLSQIMQDERLSLDERKEIYREELETIRDYEQQKRDLRVEQIDNTVSQLTEAITKQLEEMQEKDKEFIDKQIEEIEKLKEIRINAINEEYDAKIEAIEKELDALDKAEQQKSRDEEDAEHEAKRKRLEDLIAFEHDATTKANYQKELDKVLAEYQKELDSRALEDKKEALNAQKDLIQEEQDNKVQAVEEEVEKQKEIYDKQLEDLEKYYNEQINIAQDTAENMLMNVEQNQNQILNLLQSYGNAYEITGQTLGEKLAQGINEGIANKLENVIQRIQDTIDAGIENKLAQLASSVYSYEAGANKPQTSSINITQQNYIEQNPELPSETYRKLNDVSLKLAEEFAGM